MAAADPLAIAPATGRPDAYWRSLYYFSLYRLTVAGVFLLAVGLYGVDLNLGSQNARLFVSVCTLYFVAALGFLWWSPRGVRAFDFRLSIQIACDILALTLMMYASGGAKSGIGVLIFIVLAGAGLVGQGRLILFYAALATLATLFEQVYRVTHVGADLGDMLRTGLTCIGYFATAVVSRLLGRKVVANEELARQRGQELDNQLQINQSIIHDMQDGVLVVDVNGRVRQHNPQAEVLLGAGAAEQPDLAAFSPELARRYAEWSRSPSDAEIVLRAAATERTVRARLLPPGEGGHALIYVEDMGRIQEQAQQLKLAALGRLTANMAHEIRNPLSAISHAAELLADEPDAVMRRRLVTIIGDNTQRLNRLVAEVLELGRRDRAQAEDIDGSDFVARFVEEFCLSDPALAKRVTVGDGVRGRLRFDRGHLHRVLWNLVSNAVRHASERPGAVRIWLHGGLNPDKIEIHLVDDGPGVEETLRAQVFEPFFTTHGSGTGLGLFIARELCEANGARLDLLEDGPGAHFRIVCKGEAWSDG